MNDTIVIHWFRQDLRLGDNPALHAAAAKGRVLPVFILDDEAAGPFAHGAASRWWLHHSLTDLDHRLDGRLQVFRGDPGEILGRLIADHEAGAVHWNRCYEPWRRERDEVLEADLEAEVRTFNGSLLWEPEDVLKSDGTPYRVFTPYYRKGCLNAEAPREPLPEPPKLELVDPPVDAATIADLGLLPKIRWDEQLEPHWTIGEAGARRRLEEFLTEGLPHYKGGRDLPAKPYVSRLSPYLHWGEISPHTVWHALADEPQDKNNDHFRSELGWREFSHSLLWHFPELPRENLQAKFDRFPWKDDPGAVEAWQKGLTGVPIVDAGMRQLWQTGYVHNRVRMIVGSYLVKNLLQHWHHGERWFWDCLVDADLANNSASWQWIAGCGADAAPYFRIFNPVTQGKKFDPDGAYVRRFVPELADLPDKWLFDPWEAPADVLREAGVVLGETYPEPFIDLKASRERALEAFQSIRGAG